MIRVFIDAGSAITRTGLESMISEDPAIEIVHQASDADVVVNAQRPISENVASAQILAAVYAAAAGLAVTPAEDNAAWLPHAPVPEGVEPLTAREMDVLEMLAEGLSNKMIAHGLSISDHTAKFHVNSILAKLRAGTRTEAVTRGIRLGLIRI